ncbi:MAG: DUF4080 domain-containing protein [Gammaproteobacteria bacterium]
MPDIVLATLNAKYLHAALGLRYLAANLGELERCAAIREFVVDQRPAEIVEDLLGQRPRIVGLGVYIWNVDASLRVAALIKAVAPEVILVLGGPEVSHETAAQPIAALADYVITGWGDISFARLCRAILAGAAPARGIIAGEQPPLAQIELPYRLYDEADIAHRVTYVEASRGCPYKCEFCLSALDRTAWPFDLDRLLGELDRLHARGARHFKFVDRTFNLAAAASARVLEFFLDRLDERLFLHFELVPDRLPATLEPAIARFPPGALQFEIGIQTFDPQVQARISRRQDDAAAERNLRWLRAHTHAHLHVDLIAGLPGEDLAGFGRGFDRLLALDPHEIQVGILKRLRGAPIDRHTEAFALRWNPHPPYEILATDRIGFADMQRLGRFARYWDLIGNSGRFARTRTLIAGAAPFARFMALFDWLYARTRQTHRFAADRLFDLLAEGLPEALGIDRDAARDALCADYAASGLRGSPRSLAPAPVATPRAGARAHARRQARHRRDAGG